MEKVGTDVLRLAAPNWSLGGDRQLLDLLQNIHQKIMVKCTETNVKFEELVDSLDTASVDLQNVNNKFMALSNSQFVECRVYDDDIDVVAEVAAPKEPQVKPAPNEELLRFKESLLVIESMHEPVQILDSDTSDDEDDGRVVLKPKDLYPQRPLPYIIGSQLWRKKWHSGLLVEDSDSDSAGSKPAQREEYSESEPEITDTQTDKQVKDMTISSSNTSVDASASIPACRPVKPADVAAELARRLGGDTIPPPPPPEDTSPGPMSRKVNRPAQPPRSTIFSNEPPPLDQCESDRESDDDIFAELHKNRYPNSDRVQNPAVNVVDELFGNSPDIRDKVTHTMAKQPLFDDESESELFVDKPKEKTPEPKDDGFKKPVGGISLFGSNKDANSIGAAILKRNQRQSSSDEEAEAPVSKLESKPVSNKNIIEDLFVKPKAKKPTVKNKEANVEKEIKTEQKTKVTLFDDLFDDIDDIFTSKVIEKRPDNNKSLFDDDLFSEVAVGKQETPKDQKRIFDSDDELFSDVTASKENVKAVTEPKLETPKSNMPQRIDKNDILFEEDKVSSKLNSKPVTESNLIKKTSKQKSLFDDDSDEDLFKLNNELDFSKTNNIKPNVIVKETNSNKDDNKRSIFDDESDDELFGDPKTKQEVAPILPKENLDNIIRIEQKNNSIFGDESKEVISEDTPSEINKKRNRIFEDDSEEELFTGKNKTPNREIDKTLQQSHNNTYTAAKESHKQDDIVKVCDKDILKTPIETITNNSKEEYIPKTNDDESILEKTIETNKKEAQNTLLDSKHEKNIVNRNSTSNQSPSIFDDDEMDDLFSNKFKQSNRIVEIEDKLGDASKIGINPVELIPAQNVNIESKEISSKETQDEHIFQTAPQPPIPDSSSQTIDSKIIKEPSNSKLKENNTEETSMKISALEPNIDDKTEYADIFTQDKIETFPEKPKEAGIFTDIFNDMPPEFEKPKEPKKSKNVNALFDDDSDDEASFFKKSDVIPEDISSPSYDTNERFSIFHDEPPAIDIDFIQQPVKSNNSIDIEGIPTDNFDIYNTECNNLQRDQNVIDDKSEYVADNVISVETESKSEEINQNEAEKSSNEIASLEDSIRSTNAMITDKINKMQTNIKNTDDSSEAKENKNIGKLKPVTFNINVNTLLPGSSPKKSKPLEDVDGITVSKMPESTETAHAKEAKSVNFEDEKESEILNNKLSKERAKIQVKRRPSTRRARKEAARKSGIDFGQNIDSTDNSSSVDEPARSQMTIDKTDSTNLEKSPDKECGDQAVGKNINDIENEFSNNSTDRISNNNGEDTTNTLPEDDKYSKVSKNVTSKVVYILNDEDIFSDVNKNPDESKSKINSKSETFKPISTICGAYRTTDKAKPSSSTDKSFDNNHNPGVEKRASIFDSSDSDGELFGAKKVTLTSKSKLFESDSDDDIFSGKTGKSKRHTKAVKEEIRPKGSLFGDESDDDIFSTKTKKRDETVPKELSHIPSETVFEDPLSMLTQEEN